MIAVVQESKPYEICSHNVAMVTTYCGRMAPKVEVRYYRSCYTTPFNTDLSSLRECIGIAVICGTAEVEVHNVYIPPVNSCEPRHLPSISSRLEANSRLVLRNVNAHHELWQSV